MGPPQLFAVVNAPWNVAYDWSSKPTQITEKLFHSTLNKMPGLANNSKREKKPQNESFVT